MSPKLTPCCACLCVATALCLVPPALGKEGAPAGPDQGGRVSPAVSVALDESDDGTVFVLMLLFGERRKTVLLCVSVGLPSVLFLVFEKLAMVSLPQGVLKPFF